MDIPKIEEDIAIVGGGMVGLCAALALQHPDRKISILESGSLLQNQGDSTGLNMRSIALSYASVQIFKALGLWDEIKRLASPIRSIHISAKGCWGVSRLHAADYDLDALGYVIESRLLERCLVEKINQTSSISLITHAVLESVEVDASVQLNYRTTEASQAGRHNLQAKLLLIADGAQSKAREMVDIEHRVIDYAQSAIITNVRFDKPKAGIAYERFTESGPLAMLPLSHDCYACVWTCEPESAPRLMALDDGAFIRALQDCFGFRLGFIRQIGERFSFPLRRTEALSLTKTRCVVIGNAANALHPVAGQGFNLGLRDIAGLQAVLAGKDLTEACEVSKTLAQYERLRGSEQRQVVGLGDGLVGLFSNNLPVLSHVRGVGLALLDITPALKSEVALYGMGLTSAGNAMLRGQLR